MNASNIVVQAVGTKEVKTRFGAKPTYSFKGSDGNWYKTGFKEVVAVGECISFDYMPGTYGNEVNVGTIVRSAVPAAVVAAPAAAAAPKTVPYVAPTGNKGSFPIGPLDGQRSIVRQNALTNARELVASIIGTGVSPEMSKTSDGWIARQKQFDKLAEEIIRVAKMFESYTTGDADLAEVTGEMAAEQIKKAA